MVHEHGTIQAKGDNGLKVPKPIIANYAADFVAPFKRLFADRGGFKRPRWSIAKLQVDSVGRMISRRSNVLLCAFSLRGELLASDERQDDLAELTPSCRSSGRGGSKSS